VNINTASIESEVAVVRGRAADYLALTKPRVVTMVLVTTLAGFYLGASGGFDFMLAFNLLIGTALSAGGTLALNQYVERDTDALMERTRHRPLPDGRMRPVEALAFATVATTAGFIYLGVTTNWLCTAVTAAITVIYLFAYTPLKRVSWLCDVIGAVPGALPPVAGWAAVRGGLALEPWLMFAIMFLWQLPHTFAVARLYRSDYRRAGIHLLPDDDARGGNPSNPVVIAANLGLIAVGIAPTLLGYAGIINAVVGAALGAAMLGCGYAMVRAPGKAQAARRLLFASLFYLPIVLLVLVLDKV
jgi:protoheme IX farnesyltransferase